MPDRRVALVTGGAGGIGSAIARRLSQRGYLVVVADLDGAAAREVAATIGGDAVEVDVGDLDSNHAMVDHVRTAHGRLDVVALHAGANTGQDPADPLDLGKYRRAVGVNLDGVVFGIDAVTHALAEHGGAIVVTASLAALAPQLSHPLYTLTKSATMAYARAMAAPLASRGVTINVLCPGYVDTPMISELREPLLSQGFPLITPDQVAAALETVVAEGRSGEVWTVVAGRTPAPFAFPDFPWPLLPDGTPAPMPTLD